VESKTTKQTEAKSHIFLPRDFPPKIAKIYSKFLIVLSFVKIKIFRNISHIFQEIYSVVQKIKNFSKISVDKTENMPVLKRKYSKTYPQRTLYTTETCQQQTFIVKH
jgi:hypothetical protein